MVTEELDWRRQAKAGYFTPVRPVALVRSDRSIHVGLIEVVRDFIRFVGFFLFCKSI